MSIRPVKRHLQSAPKLEGAGVRLHRGFGFGDTTEFDPFLLFDDFRGETPGEYQAGFPWHPHRGIETITYVLKGTVDHADSLGNSGTISAGDVQWMTAGRGIIHQEMPHGAPDGGMHGFQLWANLPAQQKMTTPRYQEVHSPDIPEVIDDDGTIVRVVCGDFWGKTGVVDGVAADPIYLDVSVPPLLTKRLPVETSRHAFAYVFAGGGSFRNAADPRPVPVEAEEDVLILDPTGVVNRSLVVFDRGDEVVVDSGEEGVRFLLVSGKPLVEPVAWHGPIVMNTREEIHRAMKDLEEGTFLNPPS
jgi:redox-sensitive bicupin YhaK (pirin superfamily)